MSDMTGSRDTVKTAMKPQAAAANTKTVKVTLHLSVPTAQRLGVESAMRRIPQSAIAEEVLATYLSRWKLPAEANPPTHEST